MPTTIPEQIGGRLANLVACLYFWPFPSSYSHVDAGQLGWFRKESKEAISSTKTTDVPETSVSETSKAAATISYLSQLDGVRFIAVALVLYDHWMAERNTLPLGPLGVTIFFVLSGFLITRILLSSKDKLASRPDGLSVYLKTFYIRRTIRIFPLYYFSLLLLAVLNVPPVRETLAWCVLYATNIYIAYYQQWMGVIDHFWSLAVEEQVYLIFPLLLFIVPRRHVPLTMILMIIGSVLFRYYLYAQDYSWVVAYVFTPACLDSFGLGALLAYLWLYQKEWIDKLFTNSLGVVAALAVYVVLVVLSKTYDAPHNVVSEVWDRLAGSVLGFFLIGRAAIGFKGWMRWFLENPVSRYLGQISYGLYIFHNLVYNFYHTPPGHPTIRIWHKLTNLAPMLSGSFIFEFFYYALLTVLMASLSWFLLEKPINALKDRFSY
ncbi:acyltransferase family protein [Larkinella sp. VNQ87]|uniref:acyltransferase family protein n=1 Tax=Larkinella sp. VNQ87 TaxID=3400921 RepID=UPI003C0BD843